MVNNNKKDGEKIEYVKGPEAETKIFDYLLEQNRPHNPTDISANLKVIKKVEVVRALTNLFENQLIEMKSFGKQSVYCCKQSDQITISAETLKERQNELDRLKEEVKTLKETNKGMKAEIEELGRQPVTAEIPVVKNTLRQEWIELQNRLQVEEMNQSSSANEGGGTGIKVVPQTTESIKKLDQKLLHFKNLWINRRKTCKEVMKTLKDQIEDEEQRNQLEDQIGLEIEPDHLLNLPMEKNQSINHHPPKDSAFPQNQIKPNPLKRTLSQAL